MSTLGELASRRVAHSKAGEGNVDTRRPAGESRGRDPEDEGSLLVREGVIQQVSPDPAGRRHELIKTILQVSSGQSNTWSGARITEETAQADARVLVHLDPACSRLFAGRASSINLSFSADFGTQNSPAPNASRPGGWAETTSL